MFSTSSRTRFGPTMTAWNVHEAALYGSSHYDLPIVLRWFTANIGVHHVHHLCSRIPFYRLPLILRHHPELAKIGRLTLAQSFACVRLVLWDETARRLISFRELRTLLGAGPPARRAARANRGSIDWLHAPSAILAKCGTVALAVRLAKATLFTLRYIIDIWPDNRAVSPSLNARRTFRPSKHRQIEPQVARTRVLAQVHLRSAKGYLHE